MHNVCFINATCFASQESKALPNISQWLLSTTHSSLDSLSFAYDFIAISGGVFVSLVLIAMKTGVGVICSRCDKGNVYARGSSALSSVNSFFHVEFSCSHAEKNWWDSGDGRAQGL